MKNIAMTRRVKVSADGRGVVSHAGMGLVRELADLTGLSAQVTEVWPIPTRVRGPTLRGGVRRSGRGGGRWGRLHRQGRPAV